MVGSFWIGCTILLINATWTYKCNEFLSSELHTTIYIVWLIRYTTVEKENKSQLESQNSYEENSKKLSQVINGYIEPFMVKKSPTQILKNRMENIQNGRKHIIW